MDATHHSIPTRLSRTARPRITWAALRALPVGIWVPIVAVLLTSLAVTALSEWSAWGARRSGASVAYVLQRLSALADIKALVLEIESGERGYLLTSEPTYLEPFARAARELPLAEGRLHALVVNSPELEAR